MAVPYTFGTATAAIPLSQLDSNFSTAVTIGNTAVQLGNTVTTLNNLTLANVTISSGSVTITNVAVTTANVSGTANVSSLVVLTNETVLGNTAVTGNVTASINVTGAKLIPTGTSVTGNGLYLPAANALGLSTNGTNAVYIDSSQNVGIGTNSPTVYGTYKTLEVRGTGGGVVQFGTGATTAAYVYSDGTNSGFNNLVSGYMNFATAGTERMRIDSSGNVGIGTSSPTFDAGSGLQISRAGVSTLRLSDTTDSTNIEIKAAVGAVAISGRGSYPMLFETNGSERMRIDSSGNVGIGVVPSSWTLGKAIEVSSLGTALWSSGAGSTSLSAGAYYNSGWKYANATSKPSLIDFDNAGKIATFTVTATGTAGNAVTFVTGPFVANGGTSWTTGSSDVRLKKNFEVSQGLTELLQIEPVKFHFDWEEDSAPKRLGFKAQNLLPLIPEMVVEKEDKAEDGTPYLTITPDYILPVLVKAIQEQQALITALTTRITALETP
jgi:hypothetical protein